MSCLVLLTESYPYGGVGESGFIEPEIEFLAREFDKVIIAPVLDFGQRTQLPPNVTVSTLMLHRPGIVAKTRALFNRLTYLSLLNDRHTIKSPGDLRSDLAFSAYTLYYRRRLESLIESYSLTLDNTLFYTFWFDYMTAALSLIPGVRFVTRTHGQDTFESSPPFISRFWRQKTFDRILRCYPVSDFAASYLRSVYPQYSHKIKRHYLGTPAPTNYVPEYKNEPGKVSLYSCGRLIPEKRVLFQYDVVRLYAMSNPNTAVEWLHIGDGPQMPALRDRIRSAPGNLSIELTGSISNREVHDILSSRHFDFMLHFSTSEGLGVAICEAMSYGIPAMVTDAEGMPEAIGPAGFLIDRSACANTAAQLLSEAIDRAPSMRRIARNEWENRFNARCLRQDFVKDLKSLSRFMPVDDRNAIR